MLYFLLCAEDAFRTVVSALTMRGVFKFRLPDLSTVCSFD